MTMLYQTEGKKDIFRTTVSDATACLNVLISRDIKAPTHLITILVRVVGGRNTQCLKLIMDAFNYIK